MQGRSIFLSISLALVIVGILGPAAWSAEELTISAAASLTNVFQELGRGLEKQSPGVKLVFNFGASGALLQQINQGAPVDVFASADQQTMDQAREKGLIVLASRKNFVSNRLVLIAPGASKLAINSPGDLKLPEVKRVALGNPATVPAGRYAQDGLKALGLWEILTPKLIYGESVRQVLDYVARGEVDAGLVFATDAAIAKGKVKTIHEIKETKPIVYPIALVTASSKKDAAQKFLEYLFSPAAQDVFMKYGFKAP